MPNVVIEAMASGLPVVATPASGGLVDLLSGRTNAWLAPDVSVAGLVHALTQAIETVEARIPSWDRNRSEKQARIRSLVGAGKLILENASPVGMADASEASGYMMFGGEFEFERAFAAYEALIDTLCSECRA
jgi:glycosyltransferase involved in cell wall biosynthesis